MEMSIKVQSKFTPNFERGARTYSWTPKGVEINVHQRRERASTKRI